MTTTPPALPPRPPVRPKQAVHVDLRRVPLFAFAWGVIGLVSLSGFAAFIAPAAGPELVFTVGSRAGDRIVLLDTRVTANLGLVVGVVAFCAGVAAVQLERAGRRGARGLAVVVCVVVPSFTTIVVSAGVITVATGAVASDDTRAFYFVALLVAVILTAVTAADLLPRRRPRRVKLPAGPRR